MSTFRLTPRDEHVSGVFLRAIGYLAIGAHELRALRATTAADAGWAEFADHLLQTSDSVVEGAAHSSFAGNTIAILREGVRVSVDLDFIERLADKVHRHVKVGRALGIVEEPAGDETLTQTA